MTKHMNLFEDFKLTDIIIATPPYKNGDVISVNDDGTVTIYKTATPGPTGTFDPEFHKKWMDSLVDKQTYKYNEKI